MTTDSSAHDVVAAATRRSGLVWVRPEGSDRDHPVWHVWAQDRAYVVTGGLEQQLPTCDRALVIVRSRARQGDRLVQWVADVTVLDPATPEWAEAVALLHAERLNAPDGEEQPQRWARESTVRQLVPTGETVPAGDGDLAARPLPTA